jgi:UV DNA damage repair endonuclease
MCPVILTSNQAKNRKKGGWGVIQGSFHQSLVEIGSVVSEEKILLKFHPPFFLFLAWLEVRITGHKTTEPISTKLC